MKNLVVFWTVFVFLFSAAPAMAQQRGTGAGSRFEDFFGGQRGRGATSTSVEAVPTVTAGAAVSEDDADDARDISSLEILRAFVDAGFTVAPERLTAVFMAEVEIFSRERVGVSNNGYYRYYYSRDPESTVYVKVERRENGGVVVVGRGKSPNIRRAAEKAANDAAKKLQRLFKKTEDRIIFLP